MTQHKISQYAFLMQKDEFAEAVELYDRAISSGYEFSAGSPEASAFATSTADGVLYLLELAFKDFITGDQDYVSIPRWPGATALFTPMSENDDDSWHRFSFNGQVNIRHKKSMFFSADICIHLRTFMETKDLSTLSLTALNQLIEDATNAKAAAHANEVRLARSDIMNLLHQRGLSFDEVFKESPTFARAAKNTARGPVPPKFKDPDDASKTWSGRGKRPRWFIDRLEAGHTQESLMI